MHRIDDGRGGAPYLSTDGYDDYTMEFSQDIGEAPERIWAPSKFTTCGILTWTFGNVDIG